MTDPGKIEVGSTREPRKYSRFSLVLGQIVTTMIVVGLSLLFVAGCARLAVAVWP